MLFEYLEEIKKALYAHILKHFPDISFKEQDLRIEKPPQAEWGEFAFGCFPLSKETKKKPAEIAEVLSQGFDSHSYIDSLNANGPYINIKIKKEIFSQVVCQEVFSLKDRFGANSLGQGKTVMIEYSSPNTNKPLHIGHVRNNLLGMALANLLEFCGYQVIKANLINDRGIHICKSMLAYQKWGKQANPETFQIKGDHLVGKFYVQFENFLKKEQEEYALKQGIDLSLFSKSHLQGLKEKIKETKDKAEKEKLQKEYQSLNEKAEKWEQEFLENSRLYAEAMEMLRLWEKEDPEVRALWSKMNAWVMDGFQETYQKLGCQFDKIYRESETYMLGKEHVEKGLQKNVFYKKEDGSIWVSAEKLQQACPEAFKGIPLKDKLLLRADGTSVYITQDIGTAILKANDYSLDKSIYVVASEQNLHFKTLFGILKLLEFPWADGCYHAAYGMVTLPKGMGKIKSREGTAVDADDLIAEMTQRSKTKMIEENLRVEESKLEETALSIALAALKIFILQVYPDKDIQFDPHKVIEFTGDTGPAIQYSYARICSIFRKAKEQNMEWTETQSICYSLLSQQEFSLIQELSEFPQIIATAEKGYNVSLIANYLLNITRSYASIYAAYPILKADTKERRDARFALASATAQVIRNGMALLGASVPESM